MREELDDDGAGGTGLRFLLYEVGSRLAIAGVTVHALGAPTVMQFREGQITPRPLTSIGNFPAHAMRAGSSSATCTGKSNTFTKSDQFRSRCGSLRRARPPQRLRRQLAKVPLVVERELAEVPEAVPRGDVVDPG
jgi:hypothetical protein